MWKIKKKSERLHFLPTERIDPNPWQVHRSFSGEGMARLASSIARYGVLEPITVRQKESGYELVLGERRLRAAKLVGLERVPCRIIEIGPRGGAELSLTENLSREDPDLFEQAMAMDRLMKQFHYTQTELALRLGMSRSAVANKLRLLRLDPSERILICESELTERHARALIRIQDAETRMFAIKYVIEKEYGARKTEQFVEAMMEHPDEFMIRLKPRKGPPRPVRRLVIKDVRIFCNSVDRAITGIRDAGIDLVAEKEEGESYIAYSIRIPKYAHSESA